MTDPTPEPLAENVCSHCGMRFDYPPDSRIIISRDNREPSGLKKQEMKFCSARCVTHYQMAHEG